MGDLCRLFSRSTGLNIAIYIIALVFIIIAGSFWIHGTNQFDPDNGQKWKNRASITGVIGIIVVSLLLSANLIYYEIAFNKKCDALEQYLMRQKADLSSRLDPTALSSRIAKGASKAMAETLAQEFKNEFGKSVLEQVKKEIGPNLAALMNQ
jgi:hypothetical protein